MKINRLNEANAGGEINNLISRFEVGSEYFNTAAISGVEKSVESLIAKRREEAARIDGLIAEIVRWKEIKSQVREAVAAKKVIADELEKTERNIWDPENEAQEMTEAYISGTLFRMELCAVIHACAK